MNTDDIVTVSEFRKNTKVILDAARNTPLILRRGDELFEVKWKGSIWQGIPTETYIVSPKNTPPQKITPVQTFDIRTKGSVLADISAMEKKRDEELEYCQDEELGKSITTYYAQIIDDLWREYKAITE